MTTPPTAQLVWYTPTPDAAVRYYRCAGCGRPAAGHTEYGRGDPDTQLPDRTIYQCRDHLPAAHAVYEVTE